MESGEGTTRTTVGPLKYMSPEAIANNSYSTQSDVWSFGIVVWEILVTLSKSSSHQTQQTPHENLDIIDVAHRIRSEGLHPPIPSEAPEHIQQLLKDCWQLSPSQRPSFEQICDRIQSWNGNTMDGAQSEVESWNTGVDNLDSNALTNISQRDPIPSDYANSTSRPDSLIVDL